MFFELDSDCFLGNIPVCMLRNMEFSEKAKFPRTLPHKSSKKAFNLTLINIRFAL